MRCSSDDMDGPVEDIGSRSCVTRFVKTLLSIMEHGVKPHSKHLTEYFAFLYEFAKMGEEEVSRSVLVMKPKLKNCLLNLTGMNLLTKKIPKQAGLTIRSNVKRNQRKNSNKLISSSCLLPEPVLTVPASHFNHGPLLHGN